MVKSCEFAKKDYLVSEQMPTLIYFLSPLASVIPHRRAKARLGWLNRYLARPAGWRR